MQTNKNSPAWNNRVILVDFTKLGRIEDIIWSFGEHHMTLARSYYRIGNPIIFQKEYRLLLSAPQE
jgi:hypothetical protein